MNKEKHLSPPPKGMIGPRSMMLSKLLRNAFNEAVAEQGLFSGQQDILLIIVENEGLTLSDLAKDLGIASATASVSVKRMEKAGFIVKKPDENDARIIRLYPTEKSRTAPENIKKKMDSLEDIITQSMTEVQVNELSELLDIAIENMQKRRESNG